MEELKIVLVITSVCVRLAVSGIYKNMGPFDAVYKHIENCGNEDYLINFNIRVRKVSHTRTETEGKIIIKNVTVNNDIKLKTVLQKFTPRGWKDNFYILDYGDKGICSLQDELTNPRDTDRILSGVLYETNQTVPGRCNFQPGEYTLKGIHYHVAIPKNIPKQFIYGQYRFVCHFYYLDRTQEVGCARIYFDLVPKN